MIKKILKLSEELTDSLNVYLSDMSEENLKILNNKKENMELYMIGIKVTLKN